MIASTDQSQIKADKQLKTALDKTEQATTMLEKELKEVKANQTKQESSKTEGVIKTLQSRLDV